MILTLILTTVAFAVSTGLKTMQSRTIAVRNYKAIPIISYIIALLELSVYTSTIGNALVNNSVWPIFILAIGASIGALVGVYAADALNNNKEEKQNDN